MGDGGYIFDEELSPDFLEFEKFSFFQELGSDQKAFELTMNTFKINKEALLKIIEDNGGKLKRLEISKTWNGLCPESLLKGREVKMRLNNSDFYESEETGLQIAVLSGVQAVIMNFRGTGDFRSTVSYADEIENGEIDVDLLAEKVKRATFLSQICKSKLKKTQEELLKIIEEAK